MKLQHKNKAVIIMYIFEVISWSIIKYVSVELKF